MRPKLSEKLATRGSARRLGDTFDEAIASPGAMAALLEKANMFSEV